MRLRSGLAGRTLFGQSKFRNPKSNISQNLPDAAFAWPHYNNLSRLRPSLTQRCPMSRIQGVEPQQAGWMTRLVYWFVERKLRQLTGKATISEPVKVTAHQPRLLKAVGQMEMGQAAINSVPMRLKALASMKASTMVGCPF